MLLYHHAGTLNKLEVEVEVSPSLSVASSAELEDAEHESVRSVGGATSIDLQTDTDSKKDSMLF